MNNHKSSLFYGYVLPFVLIALSIAFAYSGTLSAPMVLDDIRTIVDNPAVQDPANFTQPSALAKPRPLTDLTFALNYTLDGTNPDGYRLVNIFIHILNSFLVYLLILFALSTIKPPSANSSKSKRMAGNVWGLRCAALAGALFFALHPLQTMAVTYIAQRYTSLAAFFALACIGFYILARQRFKHVSPAGPAAWIFFALAILSAVLAFLSKQNTAMLPGLILLTEISLFSRTRINRSNLILLLVIFCGLFGFFVLYNSGVATGFTGFGEFWDNFWRRLAETREVSRWDYLCTQFGVVARYLIMTVFPAGQNIDHLHPFVSGFWDGLTPVYFLVLLMLLSFALFSVRKRPLITLSIIWIFVSLSVESSIIPIRDAMFEQRMYLPMFGAALLFSYLVYLAAARVRPVLIVYTAAALIVIVMAWATTQRNELWQDPVALWTDSVEKQPGNDRAWNNLAQAEMEKENFETAHEYLLKALEINPDNVRAAGNKGYILYLQGKNKQALPLLKKAAQSFPRSADFQYNYGVILSAAGQSSQAIQQYQATLKLRPEHLQARMNLGVELARTGNFKEAARHMEKVLDQDRENFSLLRNLGILYFQLDRMGKAQEYMQRALGIKPRSPDILTYLGMIHYNQGEYSMAMDRLVQTMNINPNNPAAREYIQKTQKAMLQEKLQDIPGENN